MYDSIVLKPDPLNPIVASSRIWLVRAIWVAIFLVPGFLWHYTSDVYSYFKYGAPTGQIWYVFSKLFALYAVLLLWFQAFSSLIKNHSASINLRPWSLKFHQVIGSLVFTFIVLHIIFFMVAASLRKKVIELDLLLPNVDDFFHASITVGLVAFYLAIVAVIAAILRSKFPRVWRYVHRVMIAVVVLGLVHGFLIGTETRLGLYTYFYLSLGVSLVGAVFFRLKKNRFGQV